ncbi:unnamed protein product [Cladocopium goreaui]|uniref:Uncharacterized protein n=1 Tax=Cladocopium goreaui TaxID=2562237 RepID=A0A9P1DAX2_9DINO|nr:unnamed protein product [Cladocopium goreaui]
MAAPRPFGVALVLLVLAQAWYQVTVFVGSSLGSPHASLLRRPSASPVTRFAEGEEGEGEEGEEVVVKKVASPFRGVDLDGDKLDNLDEWYADTISGSGGPPTGFMKDLILRSFFGTWRENGWFKMSRKYTGHKGQPCENDHMTAYETFKQNLKENKRWIGQDDGKGWFWLVAGQNPGGLYLYVMKSPPFGERPLALIKESNVDEFFEKVNWHMLFVRLHKWNLWGGKATEFPYPMMWRLRN